MHAVRLVQKLDGDLVESECLRDRLADEVKQLARVPGLVQARRHREQALERLAIRLCVRRLLRRLHDDRRVLGDRDEDVDLVAARLPARDRLVDGEDAEELAVGGAQRREERVVRMPGVRVVAHRQVGRERLVLAPVELAGGDEVGAALQEPLVEQRLPVGRLPNLPEERLARLVAAEHGRDDEVVPLAPIEVDHDRAEGERIGCSAGDRREELRELFTGSHEARYLEEAAQPREDRRLPLVKCCHPKFPVNESAVRGDISSPDRGRSPCPT